MPQRILRVTKWLKTVPAVAVCTACNREFTVPLSALQRVANAKESLRLQFAQHKCVYVDEKQTESSALKACG